MKSAVINIKVDPKVKAQAQSVASELGFSLSALVNGYLKQLVKTKSVAFGVRKLKPSVYLEQAIAKAEEDIKAGKVSPGFTSAEDAIAWLHGND